MSDLNACAINIIVDSSDPENAIFVEIENDNGESIDIGEELTTSEGFRKIRITGEDVLRHKSHEAR